MKTGFFSSMGGSETSRSWSKRSNSSGDSSSSSCISKTSGNSSSKRGLPGLFNTNSNDGKPVQHPRVLAEALQSEVVKGNLFVSTLAVQQHRGTYMSKLMAPVRTANVLYPWCRKCVLRLYMLLLTITWIIF